MKRNNYRHHNEKLEIEYSYRGTIVGRGVLLVLGSLVALGGWNAYSNGEAWIFGHDARTSAPASTPTLFFVFVGLAMIIATLVPWPRARVRRIPDWRHKSDRN